MADDANGNVVIAGVLDQLGQQMFANTLIMLAAGEDMLVAGEQMVDAGQNFIVEAGNVINGAQDMEEEEGGVLNPGEDDYEVAPVPNPLVNHLPLEGEPIVDPQPDENAVVMADDADDANGNVVIPGVIDQLGQQMIVNAENMLAAGQTMIAAAQQMLVVGQNIIAEAGNVINGAQDLVEEEGGVAPVPNPLVNHHDAGLSSPEVSDGEQQPDSPI